MSETRFSASDRRSSDRLVEPARHGLGEEIDHGADARGQVAALSAKEHVDLLDVAGIAAAENAPCSTIRTNISISPERLTGTRGM